MAAASISPKVFRDMHITPLHVKVQKVTQADWIVVTDQKGVLVANATVTPVGAAANVAETITYGVVDVNNGGTAYDATTTTIAVDGMAADANYPRVVPYYIRTGGGEILEVITDSAPTLAAANLTVKRGCLGTTATATGLANNDRGSILNQIVLAGATVGFAELLLFPLPLDNKARLFA